MVAHRRSYCHLLVILLITTNVLHVSSIACINERNEKVDWFFMHTLPTAKGFWILDSQNDLVRTGGPLKSEDPNSPPTRTFAQVRSGKRNPEGMEWYAYGDFDAPHGQYGHARGFVGWQMDMKSAFWYQSTIPRWSPDSPDFKTGEEGAQAQAQHHFCFTFDPRRKHATSGPTKDDDDANEEKYDDNPFPDDDDAEEGGFGDDDNDNALLKLYLINDIVDDKSVTTNRPKVQKQVVSRGQLDMVAIHLAIRRVQQLGGCASPKKEKYRLTSPRMFALCNPTASLPKNLEGDVAGVPVSLLRAFDSVWLDTFWLGIASRMRTIKGVPLTIISKKHTVVADLWLDLVAPLLSQPTDDNEGRKTLPGLDDDSLEIGMDGPRRDESTYEWIATTHETGGETSVRVCCIQDGFLEPTDQADGSDWCHIARFPAGRDRVIKLLVDKSGPCCADAKDEDGVKGAAERIMERYALPPERWVPEGHVEHGGGGPDTFAKAVGYSAKIVKSSSSSSSSAEVKTTNKKKAKTPLDVNICTKQMDEEALVKYVKDMCTAASVVRRDILFGVRKSKAWFPTGDIVEGWDISKMPQEAWTKTGGGKNSEKEAIVQWQNGLYDWDRPLVKVDHGKMFFTEEHHTPWVCFGDLNRHGSGSGKVFSGNFYRGGGAHCFQHYALVGRLRSMATKLWNCDEGVPDDLSKFAIETIRKPKPPKRIKEVKTPTPPTRWSNRVAIKTGTALWEAKTVVKPNKGEEVVDGADKRDTRRDDDDDSKQERKSKAAAKQAGSVKCQKDTEKAKPGAPVKAKVCAKKK